MRKIIAVVITLITLLNISACGYFLYPERVGQKSGKIDPTIVILDAAGLLIGVLPGVVAFAVDLTTGTIFLSPGEKSTIEKHGESLSVIENLDLRPIVKDEITIDSAQIAEELSTLLGQSINVEKIKYFKPKGTSPVVLAMRGSMTVHGTEETDIGVKPMGD
jgi:hypothetical protein